MTPEIGLNRIRTEAERDKHGVIALPNGTFFVPDAEVDGTAGMYYIRHPYDGGQVR